MKKELQLHSEFHFEAFLGKESKITANLFHYLLNILGTLLKKYIKI